MPRHRRCQRVPAWSPGLCRRPCHGSAMLRGSRVAFAVPAASASSHCDLALPKQLMVPKSMMQTAMAFFIEGPAARGRGEAAEEKRYLVRAVGGFVMEEDRYKRGTIGRRAR